MSTDQALDDAKQHMAKRHGLRGAWFPIVVLACFILMGTTLLILSLEIRHLIGVGATRTDQLNNLNVQVQLLQRQVDGDQQMLTAKDARIRQLTDTLLKAGVLVPAPTVTVITPPSSPQRTPTPTPAPAPSPTSSSPSPRPQPKPSPTPRPTPSPTPTCLLPSALPICIHP